MSVESACDKPIQCDEKECGKFEFCDPAVSGLECPAAQPFCSIGKTSDFCSASIDVNNAACGDPGNFTCTSVGYFPDPFNCTKYHLCYHDDNDVLQDDPQECDGPTKQYYNSKQKACLALTAPTTQCITLRCSIANAGFFVYQPDDQFYYTCLGKTSGTSIKYELDMFRCPQGETYVSGKSCWYKCPGVNRYPHEKKTKYYNCKALNGDYTVNVCPRGGEFNPTTKTCELKSNEE